MSSTTYKYKTVTCPQWKEVIQLKGEYLFLEKEPCKAKFLSATCPIRENLHFSRTTKNLDYEAFASCLIDNCPLLDDFPEFIEFQ